MLDSILYWFGAKLATTTKSDFIMSIKTIQLDVAEGTVPDAINSAYTSNGVTAANFLDLAIKENTGGVPRVYITFDEPDSE